MGQRESGLRVSGKNLDIGEVLRHQAEARVADVIEKYFGRGFSGHVTVEREGSGFRTECVIHLDSGSTMNVSGTAQDAYASLNAAVERIAKQLRRDKRRREARHSNGAGTPMADGALFAGDAAGDLADDDEMAYADARAIVAEKPDALDRLGLQVAIARLEREDKEVLVFRNAGTGRVNVIHARPDGTIGWIDVPNAAGSPAG
jgi:ribosomal subunit interface protein